MNILYYIDKCDCSTYLDFYRQPADEMLHKLLPRPTTVRRMLADMGIKYRRAKGARSTLTEIPEIRKLRNRYLKERLKIRKRIEDGEMILEVWLDETYCHQHHVSDMAWYSDDMTVRRGNKGRRYIIVHAGCKYGWVGKPLIFESGTSSEDYHESMDASTFEKYFERLCQTLQQQYPNHKVIFHMDNARYHKRAEYEDDRTISTMRKDDLLRYLRKNGASEMELFNKKVPALRALCREKYPAPTVASILAINYGYEVYWLPPYHPALNPIENAWGIEKGYVAWTNDGSSFEAVKDMILEGFDQVTAEIWEKLVLRCYRNEDSYMFTGKPFIEEKEQAKFEIDIDSEDESDEEDVEENEEEESEEEENEDDDTDVI